MKRIYHSWEKWEDHKAGFYDHCSGADRNWKVLHVVEMFNSAELTEEFMNKVIDEWVFSCEHNLTNPSMNRIAYIGQAACCLYKGVPSTITMEAWNLLTPSVQDRANLIAEGVLKKWELKHNKKYA